MEKFVLFPHPIVDRQKFPQFGVAKFVQNTAYRQEFELQSSNYCSFITKMTRKDMSYQIIICVALFREGYLLGKVLFWCVNIII